ncbi:hypothetical protein [Candidatus Enterococcus ikei]|uniref:Uncharacterized protein n=1 Tax=Candidatus Enterococcus ikei TaxID=2815326 RepID=A0ABS3H4H9_9ENTE|nr:hypothetical protein [Enterococcus sp. DIV0869a]MBO0441950.1 hypothetical protein [Enterococcus sp. DIV0869a]
MFSFFIYNRISFSSIPTYEQPLEDYARLLKDGLIGSSEFCQSAWKSKTTNYQEVATFLTGKYGTDSQYAEKFK